MTKYNDEEKKVLLKLAKESIQYGIENGKVMPINVNEYSANLQEHRACFVTLEIGGELRGCIGSLQAHQPLVADLVHNAYAAAFADPLLPARHHQS